MWEFYSHERLKYDQLLIITLFLYWSAKESRTSFLEESVEGVPLEDEMDRRTKGIQKLKHYLLEKYGIEKTNQLWQN